MIKKFIMLILLVFTTTANAAHYDYKWTYEQTLIDKYIKDNKINLLQDLKPIYIKGQKHKPFIDYVSKKYNVPKEVFALPGIESGYIPISKSHAGAVGMWQIMKPTGQSMGLIIKKNKDERRNWKKATVAAVKYLKHLAEDYFDGDYELAILAYNAGVGNITKSIKRMKSKNAWYLIKYDKKIPKESKEYLVKFIIYAYYFDYLDDSLIKAKKS